MSLYLYTTQGEKRTPAKVHYSAAYAPNKRPHCQLRARTSDLDPLMWIVSIDTADVTCDRCRYALGMRKRDDGL